MARLTAAEQHILRHPPSDECWECGRIKTTQRLEGEEQSVVTVSVTCRGIMHGRHASCTYCGGAKRRGAKKLYPLYLAACTKAGIEPGTRWPPRASHDTEASHPAKPKRRKGA